MLVVSIGTIAATRLREGEIDGAMEICSASVVGRLWSVAFPNAVGDAVSSRVADFGEALDLKMQSAKIDLVDGSRSEVVAEDVVHQDAVVGT
jgi:hypothetical protein